MIAVTATISLMMVGLYIAAPSWTFLIRYDREQQLLFQGFQIVRAIRVYQAKPGGIPTSFEQLVQSKALREHDSLGDPMMKTKDGKPGKWRRISPDLIPAVCMPGHQPDSPLPPDTEGPFIGVMSRSEDESYGVFNMKNRYDHWCFAATDLIPPGITSFDEFKLLMSLVPEGQQPPKFKGGGAKAGPNVGGVPPLDGASGNGGGAAAPNDIFAEPGF